MFEHCQTRYISINAESHTKNIRVLLVKIKGHSDIVGNEIVDKEAKLVASQMAEGKIVSLDEGLLCISETYRMSSEITHKSWQLH